jgi:hypothetical protein
MWVTINTTHTTEVMNMYREMVKNRLELVGGLGMAISI